jgi:hypothetical protein
LWASSALLLVIGVPSLTRARQVQRWVIRHMDTDPFEDYVESPAYVMQTRIAGGVMIAMAALVAYEAYASR